MLLSTRCLRLLVVTLFSTVSGSLWGQSWQWAVTPLTTSTGSSTIRASALDGTGGYVVAGTFTGTVTFGPTTLTSTGSSDVFVARVDEAGAWTQAVRAGSATPRALAVDAAGNVVVAGEFTEATATFGAFTLTKTGTVAATTDVFVARLNPAGTWTQAVHGGGLGTEAVKAVAVDAAGNVVVGGNYSGTTSAFGAYTLTNAGSADIYVARLSAAGSWTQAVSAGSTGGDLLSGLVLDPNGTVHITGNFTSYTLSFGPVTLANSATTGAFTRQTLYVASLSSTGTWTRATQGSSAGIMTPYALVGDGAGNLVLTGSFNYASATFGSTILRNADTRSPATTSDVFVARLSSATVWTQAVRGGGVSDDVPSALAQDGQGNVIVAGYYQATAEFGSFSLPNANQNPVEPLNTTFDAFVARLSPAGTWTHAIRAGGAGTDEAEGLGVDATGQTVFASGRFASPAAFGATTLASASTASTAPFVARLAGLPLGTKLSAAVRTLALAPNPAHGPATLFLTPVPTPRLVVVLDAGGRPVRRQWLPAQSSSATLSVTGLAPGLYLVQCGAATGRLLIN